MLPPVRRSPYVIRAVPIEANLTKEDNIISNWKYMFRRYLLEINHNMVFAVQYEIDFFDHYMTWKTRGNSNDCDIFLMRHMETYKGGPLAQWECGLKNEGTDQLLQMRKLQRRYCLKILLSDVNIMKSDVENLIDQYQMMSNNDRRKLYQDAVIKIGSRLAAFGP
ncbi:unnamed protein product [Lactuca virosa]|uniref:Uncharacterized protein n=1 Tax=Lactuca virosa TaxID=75947 RepID=A0AAU9NKB4_9ASTR|nr:unnamed protein product [Lactuca virosa]